MSHVRSTAVDDHGSQLSIGDFVDMCFVGASAFLLVLCLSIHHTGMKAGQDSRGNPHRFFSTAGHVVAEVLGCEPTRPPPWTTMFETFNGQWLRVCLMPCNVAMRVLMVGSYEDGDGRQRSNAMRFISATDL